MLKHLNLGCQHERKQVKICGSKNENIKAEIMRDYMDAKKGARFKSLDLRKVAKEKEITNMPMSQERRTFECMQEIQRCRNFHELKSKIDVEAKGALSKKMGELESEQQ